jgi:hypothetical protein
MREHLSGVARLSTDPTGPPSALPLDDVNSRRGSVGEAWVAPESEPRLLTRFAVIDLPLSKSPNEASQ